jgi:energy-coupling factor transporter ATP-binding protein EcfA2
MISARSATQVGFWDTEMLTSIQLDGYRGFQRFEMNGLGRVNLLVGKNNSGKTSILEALNLLALRGDPSALAQVLFRRGERTAPSTAIDPRRGVIQTDLDIHHLFYGHELGVQSSFTIAVKNQTQDQSICYTILEKTPKERAEMFGPLEEGPIASRLVLQISGSPKPLVQFLPINRLGGIASEALGGALTRRRGRGASASPAQFITPESINGDELALLWDRIALTPDENLVLQALQFLEPSIERVAAQSLQYQIYYGTVTRGGFIAKIKGLSDPVPIGSMGDGMWRMLSMAIAITQCKGGFLLVDEIDTGLHYSAMADMWKLIYNAATEFNVQVFATTHSYDCVASLAPICVGDDKSREVTLQRIESGKKKSVPYSEEEIRVAVERGLEIR